MLTLLAALLVAPSGPGVPGPAAAPQPRPGSTAATLQITLNATDFLPGSPVKVQIQSSQDGYMVVFRVDGEGRVRVLFPLDPDLDAFVRGGKRYEVRGGGNQQSFLADDRPGNGIIYAAVSRQPLSFGQFAVNMHWDYDVLRLQREDSDVEAELTAFVSRMGDNVKFEYDLIGYRVYDPSAIVAAGNAGGFYDPYWSCLSCGWGYGGWNVAIGIGGWWPYYPYYPSYPYYPYWGYDYPYYPCCGGGGYYPPYPGNGPPIGGVVPLPPSVEHYGYRARSRNPAQPVPLDKAFQPDLGQSMRPTPGSTTASRGAGGTYAGTGRSRPRSGAASQQGSAPAAADRRGSPSVGNTAEPSGRAAPQSAPSGSGATRGASGSNGTDDRARRRPELSSDVMRRTSDAITASRPAETSQPIFREPRREALTDRSRGSSQPQRPVYREPPRTTPAGQGSQGSQPMVTRSAPQSGARSAPQSGAPSRGGAAPQMGRSSGGPPSGGGGGGGGGGAPSAGRARGRP